MTLVFKKKNDVYLELVEGERSDERTLSEYFTFEVEGAKFSPAFKNKMWDGKIRLYNTRDRTIYAGLVEDIIKFSKLMDVGVQFEGTRYDFPGREQPLEDDFLEGFLKALNPLNDKGEPIAFRDYQIEAIKIALRKQRRLLLSPTASGKSLIIYALMRWWYEISERKILIIVPTIGLVTQMQQDFLEYSGGKFADMYGIQAGADKTVKNRVVVSTWQSIYKQPLAWFAQFGSVIVDEVHTAQANSIRGIMEKLIVCPDRIGLTGTLQDAKTHQLVLKGLFGGVDQMITTAELAERGQVTKPLIQIARFDYNKDDRKAVSKLDYQGEIDFLINHEKRNTLISRMSYTLNGSTLVVFNRIEHGKRLYEQIQSMTDRKVLFVAGETNKDDRELVRQMAKEEDLIIVASLGVFSTGINIPSLKNLIFAHPTKAKIKVLQSIGRVIRLHKDKDRANIFDIVDDLRHGPRANFALRHAEERFKQYVREKFEYKMNTLKL